MIEIIGPGAPESPEGKPSPAPILPFQFLVVPEIITGNPLERLEVAEESVPQRPMVDFLRRQSNTFNQQETRLTVVTQIVTEGKPIELRERIRRPRGRRRRKDVKSCGCLDFYRKISHTHAA